MRVRKAIFPVAGLGTRFLPATKSQPKVMMPLVDRPILDYVVREAQESGIEEVLFVTGRGHSAIEDYFDHAVELEGLLREKGKDGELAQVEAISKALSPHFVRQKQARGLGHAVLCGKSFIGEEPFAVFLADDVIHAGVPCMRQLLDVWEREGGAVVALQTVGREQTASYGVIAGEQVEERLYRIRDMVEKPAPEEAPSDLAIIGRYVLPPEVFGILEQTPPGRGGEIQLTDALRTLARRSPVHGRIFEGIRYDTGDKLGFLKANVEYALRHEELGADFRAYLRALGL